MDDPATPPAPLPYDLISYRLGKNEEAVTKLEAKVDGIQASVARIEAKLEVLATRAELVAIPDRATVRNWGVAVLATLVATFIAMGGLFLASAANQLSAFQAGLSALQSVTPKP